METCYRPWQEVLILQRWHRVQRKLSCSLIVLYFDNPCVVEILIIGLSKLIGFLVHRLAAADSGLLYSCLTPNVDFDLSNFSNKLASSVIPTSFRIPAECAD